jgi:hypothetical protein
MKTGTGDRAGPSTPEAGRLLRRRSGELHPLLWPDNLQTQEKSAAHLTLYPIVKTVNHPPRNRDFDESGQSR